MPCFKERIGIRSRNGHVKSRIASRYLLIPLRTSFFMGSSLLILLKRFGDRSMITEKELFLVLDEVFPFQSMKKRKVMSIRAEI